MLTNSTERRLTSYARGAFAGDPDWEVYQRYQTNLGLLVALDHTSGNNGRHSFRDLIITKDGEGKLRDYVQEVKFDSVYFWGLVKAKGQLPDIRSYSDPATFTGTVLLYTTGNLLIRGAVYENGMIVGDLKPKEGAIGTVGMGANLLKSYVEVGGGEEDVHCGKPECDPVTVTGHRPTPPPPFPLPSLPPVSPPSFPPAPPPPTGGGGGGYTPPVQRDPCSQAKKAAEAVSNIIDQSAVKEQLRKLNIKSTTESGFAIYEKVKVDPHDKTQISTGYLYSGDIATQNSERNVTIPISVGYLDALIGTVHNHPESGYAAPSAYDIFQLIENSRVNTEKVTQGRFIGNFIVAADASTYAITNAGAADAFLKTKGNYLDGSDWKEGSEIRKEFDKANYYLLRQNINNRNLAYENAMAVVLEKYNAGITLMKLDAANGTFKPIIRKEKVQKGILGIYFTQHKNVQCFCQGIGS